MSTIATLLEPELDSTFGCLFVAIPLSSVLWGIGCLQLYLYYEKYWNTDGKWLRAYIFAIWFLDAAHQVLLLHFTYICFVKGIVQPALILRISRSSVDSAILGCFIGAMVQVIFVQRIWYVSKKNKAIAVVLYFAILTQFSTSIVYCGKIYNIGLVTRLREVIHIELALNYISLLTDTLLTGTLVWLLYKSRSGVKNTDSIVYKIILYSVGSGLVIALWAIVAAIGAQVAPHSMIYLLFDLTSPKLYFNCVLTSLNIRSSLHSGSTRVAGGASIRLQHLGTTASAVRSNTSSDSSFKLPGQRPIECRVEIDIESGSFQQEPRDVNATGAYMI